MATNRERTTKRNPHSSLLSPSFPSPCSSPDTNQSPSPPLAPVTNPNPSPEHATVPGSQMETALQLQSHQLVQWVSMQNPNNTLKLVHETAAQRYREMKKRKQAELQPKVDKAIACRDKEYVKKLKKKNDNHASAVASRDKNTFLVSQLDKCCRTSMFISAKVGTGYIELKKELEATKEENERLKRQLFSVERRSEAWNGSSGSTINCTTTDNKQTHHESPFEYDGTLNNDMKLTSAWDASPVSAPISNSVTQDRCSTDVSPQTKTSHQSSTTSEMTTLSPVVNEEGHYGTSVSNQMSTTTTDVFGTLSASMDNLEMFFPWNVPSMGHNTLPTSAIFQTIVDDQLRDDFAETKADHTNFSAMLSVAGPSIVANSAPTSNPVGPLQGCYDPAKAAVMENDDNAANVSGSDQNYNLAPAYLYQNELSEYTLADQSKFPPEKLDLTLDNHTSFLAELELQGQLQNGKINSDNYALGA